MTDFAAPRRVRRVVEPEETPEPPEREEWSGCETMVGGRVRGSRGWPGVNRRDPECKLKGLIKI